jgi:hypothetical protein
MSWLQGCHFYGKNLETWKSQGNKKMIREKPGTSKKSGKAREFI